MVTPDIEQIIERLQFCPDDAAIDDAIAALRASQWRSIAEAPKDGTRVLVLTSVRGIRIAEFKQQRHASIGVGSWVTEPGRYVCVPTHWMPLPASRASKEGE